MSNFFPFGGEDGKGGGRGVGRGEGNRLVRDLRGVKRGRDVFKNIRLHARKVGETLFA